MKIKKNMVCLGVIGCLFLGCVGCGIESAQETEAAKKEVSAETAETLKKTETALELSEEHVPDKEMKVTTLETDAAFEYVSDGVSYLDELVADTILEQ